MFSDDHTATVIFCVSGNFSSIFIQVSLWILQICVVTCWLEQTIFVSQQQWNLTLIGDK